MVSLHTETIGSGPRIVLVHGFTQNCRCWEPLASLLAVDHEVVLVDAPGHGQSFHDEVDLVEAGRLILEAAGSRPGTFVGYSMGARMLLHAALCESVLSESVPPVVLGDSVIERLVLIGATGGLETETDRIARRQSDEELASALEAQGLGSFLDRWLAMPMFASLSAESASREARLGNRAAGLAASLRHCGTGTQKPLWDRLHELVLPVSVVVGTEDKKFGPLASRLVSAIGDNAALVEISGGHAVHLESPELLLPRLASHPTPSLRPPKVRRHE